MDFDDRRTQRAAASIWRGSAEMNNDTRMPASVSLATTGGQRIVLAGHVEPAFGRQFLTPLRHETDSVRRGRQRDPHHVVRRRHFEIQRLGDLRLQPRHVLVADMAAILAQMRGDAIGAGFDGGKRRAHGIRMPAASRISQGGDVVDVDAEAQGRSSGHGCQENLSGRDLRT